MGPDVENERTNEAACAASALDDGLGACKFWPMSIVRHTKGTEYIVIETPVTCRIERGNVPAYAYRERYYVQDGGNKLWVRPKSEMEDGRFVMVDSGPYPDLYAPNQS